MPKKKGHGHVRHTAAARGPSSLAQLAQARAWLDQARWSEARQLLETLAERPDSREDALRLLVSAHMGLGDWARVLRDCERLRQIAPNDPNAYLALSEAYVRNGRLILAVRTARDFLSRWPHSEDADDARKLVGVLEGEVSSLVARVGLSEEESLEVGALHEQALCRVEQSQFGEARLLEERVLRRAPDFTPALNTISQAYSAEGETRQAIVYARRVLKLNPDNVHALGNLVHYSCAVGSAEEARTYAERLKAQPTTEPDMWVKKAEAFSFQGDDAGVLAAFHEAESKGWVDPPLIYPIAIHMAAVSAWRLGEEQEARRIWQRLAKLEPGFEIARANREDLKKPAGERHAPWSLTIFDWLSHRQIEELRQVAATTLKASGTAPSVSELAQFAARHPNIANVIPHLLDRGDPIGRNLAVHTAQAMATPDMLAALRDFALSRSGPDSLRMQAANKVVDAGLLPVGPVRMWINGKWAEINLMRFEISEEQMSFHAPDVEALTEEAILALRGRDAARAETLLQRALELEPDAPDLQNNLAVAYEMQGRSGEAYTLSRQIYERHPDYFFGRISMAGLATRRGEHEEARAMLTPLLSKRKLHITEWRALCTAEMELALAEGNRDGARSWLTMWEDIEPDHPAVMGWRLRLDIGRLMKPAGKTAARRRAKKR